ncbi:hypothetical protein ABFS82_12G069300 [Erythranthe guttata]|uniref:wall-associated receptor kinase-like 8 n=1 Tax=Erythranthe guttata TaxID=4155 RepID=UPI00064D764B|nr:PREDICTED: wall-associated receptor kinase-like 8 [Erythranthe guttata]|eukprot:XP_012845723.1 PREDICTED: wall-associated receptor kinase-like 8 [Erythranthe guttata]
MWIPFILLRVISSLCLTTTLVLAITWSKPGCQSICGNITIPYPFGIGSHCSFNSSFEIVCQNSTSIPPRRIPLLSSINMEALNISLWGAITVVNPVATMKCSVAQETQYLVKSLKNSPFTISGRYNSLVVLGCQNSVWLRANATTTVGGCMAMCDANSTESSCNGVNCCQTTIPPRLKELKYTYQGIKRVVTINGSCGYAFPVNKEWFQFEYKRYKGLQNDLLNPYDQDFVSAPLVLEWELDSAQKQHNNFTHCVPMDPIRWSSLLPTIYFGSTVQYCACDVGYEGNPYLPTGCSDIDECSDPTLNRCINQCFNLNGTYECDHSYENESNVTRVRNVALISVGSGLGALILLLGAWKSTTAIKRRIKANRKRKYFKRNGGLLLQQQLSSTDNGLQKTKLFSSKELEKATDHYNENRVLGRGGQGTVYKGMLTDGRIVAVKKSMKVDEADLEVFINEVVILSQINHRNVVKLMGCCLETDVPLLVYEFIPNGTLFQHVHNPNEEFPLSWEMRVRIAREVAGALFYLHSASSAPIYHRDIKSTNILLDDKYRAKVADFGTSRSIGIDQTHLTTRVLGTFGYLDPEYFQSNHFTEKSDVYSFGVVMVELLTGEKAISSIRADVGRSLATHFLYSMEENCLFDILDARVLKEGKREEIAAIAELAKRCLHLNGRRRPTMKEVAVELEGIQMRKEGGSVFQQNQDDNDITESSHDIFSSISTNMHTEYSLTPYSPDYDDRSLLNRP